jgi:hypothetical protein
VVATPLAFRIGARIAIRLVFLINSRLSSVTPQLAAMRNRSSLTFLKI